MTKKAPKVNAGKAARVQRHRRGTARAMVISAFLAGFGIIAMPTLMVAAVALVPSLVAYIVDLTPGRYAFRCVLALNISGMAPSILRLWHGTNDMASATAIIGDPFAWLLFYGAASIGWMLFLGLPGAVAVVLTMDANRRLAMMRHEQRELVEEWGAAITKKDDESEAAERHGADEPGGEPSADRQAAA